MHLYAEHTIQVPKCGSTTVGGVMKDLSRRNNFSYHSSTNYWRWSICFWEYWIDYRGKSFTSQVLSPTEEKQLATQLVKMGEKGKRLIFDRHFFTLVRISGVLTSNYSKQDSDLQLEHNFDWINFVREPVARLVRTWIQPWKLSNQVSMYHYLRKSSRWTSKKSRPPEVSFFLLQNQD